MAINVPAIRPVGGVRPVPPAAWADAPAADGWRGSARARRSGRVRTLFDDAVVRFTLAGLASLVAVAVAGTAVLLRIGTEEAIADARTVTAVAARGIVAPALDRGLLTGDPASIAAMDTLIRERVLIDPVIRVKLWAADGTVLYSDQADLIGRSFVLGDGARVALASGVAGADLREPADAENEHEQGLGRLLEVYQPVRVPDGRTVLMELYLRYDAVAGDGRRIWGAFAPVLLVALAVLALFQVPPALRLRAAVRKRQAEREALLRRAIDASELERRRIAAELHDGLVQQLAGLSWSLAASADRVRRSGADPAGVGSADAADGRDAAALTLDEAAAAVRRDVREVRSIMVQIHPPNLAAVGLERAMADLLAPLEAAGVACSLDAGAAIDLAATGSTLVYRVAREAIRNVAKHARANRVAVTVWTDQRTLRLEVTDDGVGFEHDSAVSDGEAGHLGLRLMRELADDAGASLDVHGRPGAGTTVRLAVPREVIP